MLNKKSRLTLFLFIIILSILTLIPDEAPAQGLGIGIIIGEPTGLSAKYHFGSGGIDLAIAWNIKNDKLAIHSDYLYHIPGIADPLILFVGIGIYVVVWEDFGLAGIRIPLGMEYILKEVPLGFFAEIVPGLDLIPSTDFSLQAALGIRWYFG